MVQIYKRIAQDEAARIVGESNGLRVIAHDVWHLARKAAVPHIQSDADRNLGEGPHYFDTIQIEHQPPNKWGVQDWYIYTDDWASYHIEVGHFAPDKHTRHAVWVEGQDIFKQAIEELPGKWVKTKR